MSRDRARFVFMGRRNHNRFWNLQIRETHPDFPPQSRRWDNCHTADTADVAADIAWTTLIMRHQQDRRPLRAPISPLPRPSSLAPETIIESSGVSDGNSTAYDPTDDKGSDDNNEAYPTTTLANVVLGPPAQAQGGPNFNTPNAISVRARLGSGRTQPGQVQRGGHGIGPIAPGIDATPDSNAIPRQNSNSRHLDGCAR